MCQCTPTIRTPYCGKGQCVWPGSKPEGARHPLGSLNFGQDCRVLYVTGLELRTNEKLRALYYQLLRDAPHRVQGHVNTDTREIWLDPIEHEVLT
jgi:hypothetical protein